MQYEQNIEKVDELSFKHYEAWQRFDEEMRRSCPFRPDQLEGTHWYGPSCDATWDHTM